MLTPYKTGDGQVEIKDKKLNYADKLRDVFVQYAMEWLTP